MSEATLNDYELLEKLVRAKLKITPRIEKELELLAKAPAFIPKAFLQAYQHVILENNTAGVINESHSQIAYELGLTTVEPPSNISFHYPVNPGDLPDIDTDFAFPGDIKEYIKQKYGEDRVLGIPTYGRYRVKSLINDLCRVLLDDDGNPMVDPEEARALNKKLPFKIDAQIAGDIAEDEIAHEDDEEETMGMDEIFSNKDLQDFERKYPKVFEHFKLLYALPKYRGQHAAGTVILPNAARETLPLSLTKKTLCTEWTEGQGVSELGSVGAIKIDILGLKTLKVLDTANKLIMSRYDLSGDIPSPCVCYKQGIECITNYKMPFMIREATGERLIDFNALCLNIPKVYKAIGNYETQGVFQFEPEGISAFTHKYEPKEFYDLALITALYRPGPLDARLDKNGLPLDPEDPEFRSSLSAALNFIERRKGNLPIIYPSKKVESVLKNSYGIAVFQEVLSQMIMAMTNCSFAEAEKVRKFLTKVKPELVKTDPETIAKLASFKDKFVKQSKENGCSIKEIEAVWNLIVPFARYGFNKAHAVTYSLITYQTAFCRTLFPLEYLTSLMYHNVHNTAGKDKVIEYIRTAQKLDFVVNPPDINSSFENFTINEKGEIVGGLNMIKKVGDKAAALIIENRNEEGPFESLEDFLSRKIRWQIVKIDVLKALTHAGAFDSISPNRKLTWAKILVAKKKKIEETEEFKGIKSFETIVIGEDENGNEIKEIYLEDYSNVQKSTYARELFGFLFEDYITKNKDVINRYKDTLKIIASQKKKQVSAGTIEEIKIANQKNGQKYARITVTNLDGIKEQWLLFAHIWDVYKNDTKVFETYFAMGKKDDRTLLVDTLRPIGELLKLS